MRDTLRYSDASGFPLPSFAPVITSLPLLATYPSKMPSKTFAGGATGASTSPLTLNLRNGKDCALPTGVNRKDAKLQDEIAERRLTPVGKVFQPLSCFGVPGLSGSSSNIAYE